MSNLLRKGVCDESQGALPPLFSMVLVVSHDWYFSIAVEITCNEIQSFVEGALEAIRGDVLSPRLLFRVVNHDEGGLTVCSLAGVVSQFLLRGRVCPESAMPSRSLF